MNNTPIRILMLKSGIDGENDLTDFLRVNGFHVEDNLVPAEVEMKLKNHKADVVISGKTVNELNGFDIYKLLKPWLVNHGIPYFMVLEKFEKEDILLGLEMGIDNFIFTPLNPATIIYKIENELNKKRHLNIFETGSFREYFNKSSVAMFYIDNNRVIAVNNAFAKMNQACKKEILDKSFDSLFNLNENKENELNHKRFLNGITGNCNLVDVKCSNCNNQCEFLINLYRSHSTPGSVIFGELLPVHESLVKGAAGLKGKSKRNGFHVIEELSEKAKKKLTFREQHVFSMSAQGLPIKIIADKLQLSNRTVEKHRANIMAKAGAKNFIEAITILSQD